MVLTLLPYESFSESARVLDRALLSRQRLDGLEIIDALVATPPEASSAVDPGVAMWGGYGIALTTYILACCNEWTGRGYRDGVKSKVLKRVGARLNMSPEAVEGAAHQDLLALEAEWGNSLHMLPPWLGLDELHTSHQAYLLRKNPGWYRKYGWDVDDSRPLVWPSVGEDGQVVVSYASEPVNGTGPEAEMKGRSGMTRTDVVASLREKGYEGPVSYSKTRLVEMLSTVEAGGTIDIPRRGRPKQQEDAAANGDTQEGDLRPTA